MWKLGGVVEGERVDEVGEEAETHQFPLLSPILRRTSRRWLSLESINLLQCPTSRDLGPGRRCWMSRFPAPSFQDSRSWQSLSSGISFRSWCSESSLWPPPSYQVDMSPRLSLIRTMILHQAQNSCPGSYPRMGPFLRRHTSPVLSDPAYARRPIHKPEARRGRSFGVPRPIRPCSREQGRLRPPSAG